MKQKLDDDTSQIWSELGNHGARITVLETNESQHQQWQTNHRAETMGMVKDLKDDIYGVIKPLAEDVSSIKGYLKWGMGYGLGIGGTVLFFLEIYRTFSGK